MNGVILHIWGITMSFLRRRSHDCAGPFKAAMLWKGKVGFVWFCLEHPVRLIISNPHVIIFSPTRFHATQIEPENCLHVFRRRAWVVTHHCQ